jgi:amino acid adenylation domain-containing protein
VPSPIKPRGSTDPAPLSFAQERLWFLEQLEPEAAVYNICRAWRLLGNLSSPAVEASLNEIVSRHETLRTAFRLIDGKPVQIVQPSADVSIKTVDLSSLQEDKRQTEIAHTIKAEAEPSFDLSAGQLLRCTVIRALEDEHVLILTTHHSVSDAWSMGILTRELWTLYEAFSNGKSSPLEPLPVQYSDYAVWQRNWLQGDVFESQLAYWKERLKDLSVLNLPTDRPRKPHQSFYGARLPIVLPEDLTNSVNELSHRFAVTPFMILLAAFQVLLYRYTGQEDVVVGSPIANRRRPEIEGLIGFFVNTLVLRADLSGNPSFSDFLLRVRNACVDGDANQDLPFEKLVQELQPERDQSRNPLFQVMFVLQNATRPFTGMPSLRIEPVEVATTRSPFDLSLLLREREGKYIGYIEYSTHLFDRDRIERMAGHYRTLLEAIVSDPDQPIATLPILTEAERHQMLVQWNDTAADYPKDKCIHHLFEEQAERTPEAIALEFEDQQITYRELNQRANQLAHYLTTLGIGPEKLVGICVEPSIEMVVGLLGILKAAGAYVPLDPAYPKERLRFMLEDSRASVLLTQEKWVEARGWKSENGVSPSSRFDSRFQVVYFDRDGPDIEQQSSANPSPKIQSRNLAYVIYTSGSTGQPKGVAIEHRNTLNLLYWAKSAYEPSDLASVLASTSICFDLSIFELFVPLSWGGKIILVESALSLRERADRGITLVNTVPSAMAALVAAGALPESVRVVNLAGEVLRPELVNQLYRTGTVEKVYDLYGPSETTTYSTFARRTANGPATIGRPIANTKIYLFDTNGQPVPVGVRGEIFIGGAGLAREYLYRPDLTKDKFINDSFTSNPGARLYKTGDFARLLPDGNLQFLDRRDNQVKIRGYRIELGEIEAVLNQHPAVKDTVVVARGDVTEEESSADNPKLSPRLVAYIVPTGHQPSASDLRGFLKEKLPEYMLPSAFVPLGALPLMPNGKLNRNRLPPPDGTKPPLSRELVSPRTEIEKLVAQTWRDVLKVENVGICDNFFELGGHSLLATRIVARLQEAFNKDVPLHVMFDAPTVAELAQELETIIRDGRPDLPPIFPVSHDAPLPLSMNQEHLWQLDQMMSGTHFFNMPYVYRLNGELETNALEKALSEIIRRHEALRTVFVEVDGKPVQIVREMYSFRLPVVDLRKLGVRNASEEAGALILGERERAFNLTVGPLTRIKLLRLTDKDYLLLVTMHHIISDHWSMQIFRRELAALYEAFFQERRTLLPEPLVQFADYASWERRLLDEGLLNEQLAYWKNQLAGPLPQLEFQKSELKKVELSFHTAHRPIEFDEALRTAIKAFASKENCTPFMVVVAALSIVLCLQTGQQDIRIGTLVANRKRKETECTIGHLMNTVILRMHISPDITCKQFLRAVRDVILTAYAHQELPFERLAHVLEKEEKIDRASLVQVLLIYNATSYPVLEPSGPTFAPLDIKSMKPETEITISTFDLIIDMRQTSTKLTGSVNYKTDTFDAQTINAMIKSFGTVLESIVTRGEQLVSAVGLDATT